MFPESPEAWKDATRGHGEKVFHPGRGTEEGNFQFSSTFRMAAAKGECAVTIIQNCG